MYIRIVRSSVLFLYPFQLQGEERAQQAGLYSLLTYQEILSCTAFTTYRTILAVLEAPAPDSEVLQTRKLLIDMNDLDACVRADRLAASAPALQHHARAA